MSLRDLTIVVTRPEHQAQHFQHMLEQEGARVLLFPVLEICDTDAPALAQLKNLSDVDIAIFISPNAVHYGHKTITDMGLDFSSLKMGAIGKKTARALHQCGYSVDYFPEHTFNSESFLDLPAMQNLQGKRILIFRGSGGRELLANTLGKRGADVTYADVYQRKCPDTDGQLLKKHAQEITIITLTSSESAFNLFSIFQGQAWLDDVPLLLGSPRIFDKLKSLKLSNTIIVAQNPSDESMLEALLQWQSG